MSAETPPAPETVDASPTTAAGAAGDRLPDLVMLPLQSIHLGYEGQEKVLRFTADVLNDGDGPMQVTGVRSSTAEPDLQVSQEILQAEGGWRSVETDAVMRYETFDGHDHFHLQEFQRYQLRPEGSDEWRGSRKEGWCLRDDGSLRGAPSRYSDEDYYCGEDEENDITELTQGMSEGWVDSYSWYLEGQYIELAGLELPGNFCLEAEADPNGALIEKSDDNNVTSTLVRITEAEVSVVEQGC
ncbi:lysyl oxidase family protein [Kocuria rosea]|uniref:lysyl oxidase family protein n=1 Tax=Kocuria rosea TaxID=1275 RepID=UPI0025421414|nr:lysyl oxidase family protein [Kocuria rosea]WIG16353.1 lysyl oxidase family protein [Kocuria rosea]